MSPYTRFYAGMLFPLQERLKGHWTQRALRDLEHTQWVDGEHLCELRLARLRRLLIHAGRTVPYYQRLFAEYGFDPQQVSSLSDLGSLPLLSKAEIRREPDAFRSSEAGSLVRSNTGGSSGEPLVFWLGRERVTHDVAAKWRAMRWWGVDIGDPEIVLWGSPIELGAQDRRRALRDRLQRSTLLPAFEMSPEKVRGFIAAIRQRRPRMLFGYPSAVDHVARAAEAAEERLDNLGIRVAFVTGETLYDDQRERIARVFGCRVANGYGGRDAGFVAHECPEDGMHVTAEDVIVEIVDPEGEVVPEGQAGEIVVTHLASGDYPFIRYRTGDMATMASNPCSCGRGLPMLQQVHGRATDFLVAQDGTVMHGLALIYVLRDLADVDAFRIIQEDLEHTRVAVVADGPLSKDSRRRIETGFRERLGSMVHVDIEECESLPLEASGKYRYVISRVMTRSAEPASARHVREDVR